MARIFHDGWEYGLPTSTPTEGDTGGGLWQIWRQSAWYPANATVSSTNKTGNYSLYVRRHSTDNRWIFAQRELGVALKEHFGRVEFRYSATNEDLQEILFIRDANNYKIMQLLAQKSGDLCHLAINSCGSQVAFFENAFAMGSFARLEWHLIVDAVNGLIEFRRDGNSIITHEGDTQGDGLESITKVAVGSNYSRHLYNYYDDFAINDTEGNINNTWVGSGGIYLLKPNGVGNYSQWTPSNETYQNWEMVNTIPRDGDTTHVFSYIPEEKDTYAMQTLEGDLAMAPDSIVKAVQHLLLGRYMEDEADIAPVLRSGGVDIIGDTKLMYTSYVHYVPTMYSINPFTSQPWTVAGVDSLEAGVQHKERGV